MGKLCLTALRRLMTRSSEHRFECSAQTGSAKRILKRTPIARSPAP